jgi:hypothetical protein
MTTLPASLIRSEEPADACADRHLTAANSACRHSIMHSSMGLADCR